MEEKYNKDDVEKYSNIRVEQTTYGLSLNVLINYIQTLPQELRIMDFGSGTGRVTRILDEYIPDPKMVLGLDSNIDMLKRSFEFSNTNNPIDYLLMNSTFPLQSNSINFASAVNIFEEIHSVESMHNVVSELFRVISSPGELIIITANPKAMINHSKFKTYSYQGKGNYQDGDNVECTIETSTGKIYLNDFFWTSKTIQEVVRNCGFKIIKIEEPKAFDKTVLWKDELVCAPDLLYFLKKL